MSMQPDSGPDVKTTRSRLSDAQLKDYYEQGYLILKEPILSPEKFTSLRAHTETILDNLVDGERPEDIDTPHFGDPKLFEWLFDDAILDLVEPIVGPDIALFSSHFIAKPPGTGRRVPWHEDSHYWKPMFEKVDVVTLWLAIDRASEQNGAMKVIPGSHRKSGVSEYESVDATDNVFDTEIKKHGIDASKVVTIALEPNQASLHDAFMVHGSNPNTSATRRCGYTMRYMSTRARLNAECCKDWHQIYLARGKARVDNPYGDPSQAYPQLVAARRRQVGRGH